MGVHAEAHAVGILEFWRRRGPLDHQEPRPGLLKGGALPATLAAREQTRFVPVPGLFQAPFGERDYSNAAWPCREASCRKDWANGGARAASAAEVPPWVGRAGGR